MKKIKPMTAGAAILAAVLVSNASALTGSESDIINFLNKLNSFLNQTLVPLGMCGAAIAAGLYYFGSREAAERAQGVFIGAVIMLLAGSVFSLLANFAGR